MFKTAVGYFFLQLSIIGLVVNFCVLIPLTRVMKKGDKNCVYLIAIITILNDTINSLVNCLYFAPTIISSSYILADSPSSPGPLLMSSIARFSWYNGIFVMILMVINRLNFFVFNKTNMFTRQRVIIFFIISSLLSFSKVVIDIFVTPCCLVLMDHEKFGFTVLNPKNETDWTDMVDSPIEITVFSVSAISYIVVFVKIRTEAGNVEQSMDSKEQKKIRAQERSVAVQFAFISVFLMLSYASLKLTPIIFGDSHIEANMISPVCFALNCCANGCIFMFMNEEVKEDLLKKIFKNNTVHSEGGGHANGVRFEQPELMI
ncbi:hypothetical protein GCK72_018699 [Caenorhabditis remanei]|uniref:CRE-SRX-10 protein n=1 Tax=Caenorhabditis remanei TaxID=31234 RepID=E3M0K3_CAERE|nr:hypothetical protein GCK72_018699 [Caenorhabditis remanei]EFO87740.1 CRE-SRX-10 protein [Caenorhabditis remanei]KAF1752145.1 hypothetical protein GCK72_018699 [Caenorhabditis remanei]